MCDAVASVRLEYEAVRATRAPSYLDAVLALLGALHFALAFPFAFALAFALAFTLGCALGLRPRLAPSAARPPFTLLSLPCAARRAPSHRVLPPRAAPRGVPSDS